MAGQVRLVVEAGLGRRQAWRHSVEQQPPRQIDPAAGHVLMRADPELPAELPDQVGWVDVQGSRRLPERHRLAEAGVDQAAQLISHIGVTLRVIGHAASAQVPAQPFGDESEAAFRLELLAGLAEYPVQLVDALPQQRVGQHGLVDGLADEAR